MYSFCQKLEVEDFILFLRKSFFMGQTVKVDNRSKDLVYFLDGPPNYTSIICIGVETFSAFY